MFLSTDPGYPNVNPQSFPSQPGYPQSYQSQVQQSKLHNTPPPLKISILTILSKGSVYPCYIYTITKYNNRIYPRKKKSNFSHLTVKAKCVSIWMSHSTYSLILFLHTFYVQVWSLYSSHQPTPWGSWGSDATPSKWGALSVRQTYWPALTWSWGPSRGACASSSPASGNYKRLTLFQI